MYGRVGKTNPSKTEPNVRKLEDRKKLLCQGGAGQSGFTFLECASRYALYEPYYALYLLERPWGSASYSLLANVAESSRLRQP
jgi:hypothetical protein